MNTFETERLQLAIFLHATRQLRFLGCEQSDNGKLRFVFEDCDHSGPDLELQFDMGASLPATALFASQKFLRRTMSETAKTRSIEKPYAENPQRT